MASFVFVCNFVDVERVPKWLGSDRQEQNWPSETSILRQPGLGEYSIRDLAIRSLKTPLARIAAPIWNSGWPVTPSTNHIGSPGHSHPRVCKLPAMADPAE
jgi:hypothetical protein